MCLKKRLLFFDFVTHYGGAQRSTVLLCSRLKGLYDIQIVDAYGYCKPYIADLSSFELPLHILSQRSTNVVIGNTERALLRIITILRQTPQFFMLTMKLIASIQRLQPDLIWTNSMKSFFLLSVCSFFSPAVLGFYAHGWYCRKQIPAWQRTLLKKYSDIIFAVSNPTKKAMVFWGVETNKIKVVYAAVDFDRFQNSSTSKWENPRNENITELTILVPGSILKTKGQHTVIRAVKLLKNKGINCKLSVWLAGDMGVGDTSGYIEHLKSLVRENGLEEEIKFLGWRDDMPELMRQADVVVLPSQTEGLPLVIQEAIMMKRPIITTNVGGIPDLISNGITGFLIDVDDEAALANKIYNIIESPGSIQPMVNRAYNRYISLFNRENQTNHFQVAVEKALTR